ncbi:MAG: Flp pilus assembly complex ATPase component TadA [Lachnospiraceae bacterium]|nr:Flp pilus assembly complex ATPase component TadA [Lachnospiraceae bacterium]
MSDQREELKALIRECVMEQLQRQEELEDEAVFSQIQEAAFSFAAFRVLLPQEKERLCQEVFNSIRGLDILDQLLGREDISEIMINGYDRIYVEREGRIEHWPGRFESEERYHDIIQQMVSACNRMVNGASPIVDARLSDGSRLHVVLPPVALDGAAVTIRHFRKAAFTMEDLARIQSLSEECAQFLRKLGIARSNIFISGGTGAGKTSFLNALSAFIPEDERVVSIEDSAELRLQHIPNLVRLETRMSNEKDCVPVSMRSLLKASLRMRPDRIVVGEVRGEECVDMIQAMNTGQEGSLSTGHANSGRDMLARLETMFLMGLEIPLEAIRRQLSCIDVIVHLGRLRDKSRRVLEVWEILGYWDQEVQMKLLYQFEEEEERDGKIYGSLRKVGTLTRTDKLAMAGFRAPSQSLCDEET